MARANRNSGRPFLALLITGLMAGASAPGWGQNRPNDFGIGPTAPVGSGAGSAAGAGIGGSSSAAPSGVSGTTSAGPATFPGSPLPKPSLGLTDIPSAPAVSGSDSVSGSAANGGAAIGASSAEFGNGSTGSTTGPGATIDFGSNPGLYGVRPGSNATGR